MLSRVRVDAADADARPLHPLLHQRLMPAPDGALDQRGLDLLDRVDQAEVRGDEDHPHLRRGEHHRHLAGAGEPGEQLGVAREDVSPGVERLLVQRSGADGVDPAGHHQLDGPGDELVRPVSRLRGKLSEGKVVGDDGEVDAVHLAALVPRILWFAQRIDLPLIGFRQYLFQRGNE